MNNIADFCQGHGGGLDCATSFEYGCLVHGDEFDHGVISYCDGTCAPAREQYATWLESQGQLLPDATTITLAVWGSSVSYQVTFEGKNVEAQALAYIAAHDGYGFDQAADRPLAADAFPALVKALYPACRHGLDASRCMDPYGDAHFGTREQELMGLL